MSFQLKETCFVVDKSAVWFNAVYKPPLLNNVLGIIYRKMMLNDIQLKSSVVGGTLFSTTLNISLHDLQFTAIMAAIDAAVSFFVSNFINCFYTVAFC